MSMVYDPTGLRDVQPLFAKVPVATDKSIYDWSEVNVAAANKIYDTAEISSVTVDQMIFETPRNMLALQAGLYRIFSSPTTAPPCQSTGSSARIVTSTGCRVPTSSTCGTRRTG
jgi:hypothetical protein